MLTNSNPTSFKIADPSASVASGAPVVTPKIIEPIFQLNRASPDVSQLPVMPTNLPIVSHDWMSALSQWIVNLLPTFHVGGLVAGLAPLLAGIGPAITGIVTIQIASGLFGLLRSHIAQPRPRANAEYARFSAPAASGITGHLRAQGIGVYDESTNETAVIFSVARYHLGALRRVADAYGVQLKGA